MPKSPSPPPAPMPIGGPPRTSSAPDVTAAVQHAFDRCGHNPTLADDNPWHSLWFESLRDQALPALIVNDAIIPAASLWTGARLWCQAFRGAGLTAGDRILIALPPSPEFVQVLVAAMWEGLTTALLPPSADETAAIDQLDARALVGTWRSAHAWTPAGCSGPLTNPQQLRAPHEAPTPDVRFLLRTSGTTGLGRWVALSDRNLLSVLASHLPHLRLREARVLSVLPWHHAFGLVLELLPALLSGAEVIRDPSGGRDPDAMLHTERMWGATHLSAVPLTIQRLLDHPSGMHLLSRLQGGIIGGAPVPGPVAEHLAHTQLRAGYGQTEAAPGITLGARGVWHTQYMGRPLGCEVHVDEAGELHFRGPNACYGFWQDGRLVRRDPDRTVATGDLVRQDGDDLFFLGRVDDSFNLANGTLVQTGRYETRLKEQLPTVRDAFLYTPDGAHVALALLLQPAADPAQGPTEDDLRAVLGSLANRLSHVATVPAERWHTTPKGTVNRARMHAVLTEADACRGVKGR